MGLQNVLQAEVVLRDLDRELVRVRQGILAARADLAQQIHISPESDLRTLPDLPANDAPVQVDRLYRLAVATRPELKGRLAAIARDANAVELARKRFLPDFTVGFSYMDMTRQNARNPNPSGMPNIGTVRWLRSAGQPQQDPGGGGGGPGSRRWPTPNSTRPNATRPTARSRTSSRQAQAQRSILGYFQTGILPRAKEALETATSGYETRIVDFPTLLTSWREVLQIELQIAQVEAELGKALASLERAVGVADQRRPTRESGTPG